MVVVMVGWWPWAAGHGRGFGGRGYGAYRNNFGYIGQA